MLKNMQQMSAASSLELDAVRVRAPYAGLAALQAQSAPIATTHGTTVSAAGFAAADVDVPGSPPREAPV